MKDADQHTSERVQKEVCQCLAIGDKGRAVEVVAKAMSGLQSRFDEDDQSAMELWSILDERLKELQTDV